MSVRSPPNHSLINPNLFISEAEETLNFLISDFRRDLNIVYFLLGISPASNCSWPTFRNWYRVPKRRPTTIWRRGNTQKKIYNVEFILLFQADMLLTL